MTRRLARDIAIGVSLGAAINALGVLLAWVLLRSAGFPGFPGF